MSNGITLSPKYGVNPTIPVCFWCGEEKNEVALMGHIGDGRKHEDFEAPMHMVLNFEPCTEAAKRIFNGIEDGVDKAFIDSAGFSQLFGEVPE